MKKKYNYESHNDSQTVMNQLQEEFGVDFGFDLEHRVPTYNSLEVLRTNDSIIVGMLIADANSDLDFFADDDGAGNLIEFNSATKRDNELQKLSKEKKLFYLLNKYSHGEVHFSIAGTHTYPDERWDVSHGTSVYIPCDYIQSEFKKMKKTEGEGVAYEHFIKDSNSVLDSYSDWRNGDIYGYSVITFDKKGNELNCDECWGFIGSKNAEEEKHSIMEHIYDDEIITKLMKNVVTETLSPKEISLPFRITKKDLEEIKVTHIYDTYVVAAKYSGQDNVAIYNWSEGQEKPTKCKFEEWQKKYGTKPEEFLNARMISDIKDVIKKELNKEDNKVESIKKPLI